MKDKHITVRMTSSDLERLDKLAAKDERSRGNLITKILREYMEKHPVRGSKK